MGPDCSIQESSLATEGAIWLGINDAKPQIMASDTPEGGTGWVPYAVPPQVQMTTRMHLSQEKAAELIPLLQFFVATGRLPTNEEVS